VPGGEAGELLVRAPTLMQGYWGRPDLEERAFYRRQVTGSYAHVFHRTGDLVREGADGALVFLGRKDRQVKARGYRVELDEVEAALASHLEVESAAVFVVADQEGSKRIHAAVKLRSSGAVTSPLLLQHAAQVLPRYALPERVVIIDEMPRTSSGKIDRLSLSRTFHETTTSA
jgi:acyl-coenzyme A synthetase/AMP-(fatty) acid ligase